MASPNKSLRPSRNPLEETRAQLLVYARDLRQLAATEREEAERLAQTSGQLQVYARDLRKAYDAECKRGRELERAYYDTVQRLVTAAHYRDEETGAHNDRVSHYARELAQHLAWQPAAVDLLFRA